jgi:hypothetical protein
MSQITHPRVSLRTTVWVQSRKIKLAAAAIGISAAAALPPVALASPGETVTSSSRQPVYVNPSTGYPSSLPARDAGNAQSAGSPSEPQPATGQASSTSGFRLALGRHRGRRVDRALADAARGHDQRRQTPPPPAAPRGAPDPGVRVIEQPAAGSNREGSTGTHLLIRSSSRVEAGRPTIASQEPRNAVPSLAPRELGVPTVTPAPRLPGHVGGPAECGR